MSTIYIVKSSKGEYEDYRCWNEKAFTRREDAEAYARQLDKEHTQKPDFITDNFICLLRECEAMLPDWEDFPEEEITPKNRERWLQWQDEQEKKQNELLFKLMYERGQFMTQEMLDQYDEWESSSYTDWYKCTIEELELL